jgi:hypothetical protein
MTRHFAWMAALLLLLAEPGRGEEPVVQDVLDILRDRGIVAEGQYNELTAKNQSYETEHRNLLGRTEFSGDFRLRMENLWYDEDATGDRRDDRTRLRYRFRLQAKTEINDYVDVVFRLASGEAVNFDEGENRTTNRTLGRSRDFGLNPIFLDRAFIELKAPRDWVEGLSMRATGGKVYNPFRWKIGKDFVLWDPDISPEGVAGLLSYDLNERWQLFANTGYFVADENAESVDPQVFGIQGGAHVELAEGWNAGGRLSWYGWSSLNEEFFERGRRFGNTDDGIENPAYSVAELTGYVRFAASSDWPVLVYGHYAHNFDAVSSELLPAVDGQGTGWGLGVEVGDKARYAALGLGYYHLEANFWPAQFIDSDITDGNTNRAGWHVYGGKRVLPNTDLKVELLWMEPIRSSVPPFGSSVADSKRIRLRTDLEVKF